MLTETQSRSTGKERDPETGLDYFGARYNASNMGRFMSPDPEQESGFLSMDDPQAWNGYAYARNNPLLYSDPDGMSYRVCDANGKNCYNFENDADYNKWLKDNNQVERGGGIYQKNPDESQTKLGTVEYYDRDVYAMLANVDRMAGTPVRALAWTTMGFVGGMMVVEAAPLAARAMRSGLQQATGQAQNTTLKEISNACIKLKTRFRAAQRAQFEIILRRGSG